MTMIKTAGPIHSCWVKLRIIAAKVDKIEISGNENEGECTF